LEWYFTDKDEIIHLGGKELIILKGWGAWENSALVEVLGYGDRVTSNV